MDTAGQSDGWEILERCNEFEGGFDERFLAQVRLCSLPLARLSSFSRLAPARSASVLGILCLALAHTRTYTGAAPASHR